jgi:hypothetical protein
MSLENWQVSSLVIPDVDSRPLSHSRVTLRDLARLRFVSHLEAKQDGKFLSFGLLSFSVLSRTLA